MNEFNPKITIGQITFAKEQPRDVVTNLFKAHRCEMKLETITSLIQLGFLTAGEVAKAISVLENHSGKDISQMTQQEMILAVKALRVKSPEELIAEGFAGG